MPAITLFRPLQGQVITVSAQSKNSKIALNFPTDDVILSRDDNTLIFAFEDGAAIRIDDFYTSYHADNVPEFEIAGNIVSGTEFFNALGPDFIPAAGPATAERGSRYNEYGTSDLADGLDHLDGLDMRVAGSVAGSDSLQTALLRVGGLPAASGSEDALGILSGDVRAVLYSAGDSENHFVSTPVFFKDASGDLRNLSQGTLITRAAPDYSVSCSFPADWDSSWISYEFKDGQLVFTFSPEGLNQLQNLGAGEYLRGFVTVSVTKDGHTFEYNVEVVGTNNTYFNSQEYDDEYGAVTGFGKDSVGEYHQGQGHIGSYKITSSTGNDEITLNDTVIGGSYIHASGSADPAQMADDYNTILLNKGAYNTAGDISITSTDGKLIAKHGVLATGNTAHNSIDMGAGEIHISNASGNGVTASASSKNTISGDKITVTAEGAGTGIKATTDGENILIGNDISISSQKHGVESQSGGGNSVKGNGITIEAGNNTDAYGVYAKDAGTANEIAARSGQITVSAGKHALFAEAGGKNTVTGDGGMQINGAESGLYALGSGSANTVTAAAGTVTIVVANSNTYAMRAADKGTNTVNSAEAVTIGGGKFSMHAASGGQNSLTGNAVEISAANNALYATGTNSKNTVNAGNGAATLSADSAVSSFGGAQNAVTGSSVDIRGTTNGLFSSGTGSGNTVTTEVDGTISITAGTCAMHASSGGSNKIETVDGKVTVAGKNANSSAIGMSAIFSGSNNNITTTGSGDVEVSGNAAVGTGMKAESSGVNKIETVDGKVTVTGESANGAGVGMKAESSGVNKIETVDGKVTVTGESKDSTAIGMNVTFSGSNNSITTTGSGDVEVSGNASSSIGYGMKAESSGSNSSNSNSITTENGSVTVTSSSSHSAYGMFATSSGSSNTISTISGDVTVNGKSSDHAGRGMYAKSSGSNSIETESGDVTVIARSSPGHFSYGMDSKDSGSSNTITTKSGDVTVDTGGWGMRATSSGSNSIETEGGDVSISSMYAILASSGSKNTITTTSGNVEVSNVYNGDGSSVISANTSGSNTITSTSGDVAVTGFRGRFGLTAAAGNNSITTGGDITFSRVSKALEASYETGSNTLAAHNIVINSVARVEDVVKAQSGGQNTLTASSGGAIQISTSIADSNELPPYAALSDDRASVHADGGGSQNTLFADVISLGNECGKGLSATNGGVNTLESTTDSHLTVTITASADAAAKAIAMWADGGGSVNRIIGHSQAGGDGDNITLTATATNGQGIAMQASSGGENIITTGAGNDSVTINGAVRGSVNEINLGGGDNTLTINGAVQNGSLNVVADTTNGGTYTLILQADGAQGFIDQYGAWLNALGADDLLASGLKTIQFDGGTSDLSSLLVEFNDLLWEMKDDITIEPPELASAIHDPNIPTPLMAHVEPHESTVVPDSPTDSTQQEGTDNEATTSATLASLNDSDEQGILHDLVGDEPMLYTQYGHSNESFAASTWESSEDQGRFMTAGADIDWNSDSVFADEHNNLDAVFVNPTEAQPTTLPAMDIERLVDLTDREALDNAVAVSGEDNHVLTAASSPVPPPAEFLETLAAEVNSTENSMQESVEAAMRQMENG